MVAATVPTFDLQVAFDADLSEPPSTWTWESVPGLRLYRVKRGKQDQHGRMETGTMVVTVDNRERLLDPTNTRSPYYATFMHLPSGNNNYADCPDPATNITGDMEVMIRVSAPSYTLSNNRHLVSTMTGTTGWRLFLNPSNQLAFNWYQGTTSRTVAQAIPFVDGEPVWLKVRFTANTGSSHRVEFFYSHDDSNTWAGVQWIKAGEGTGHSGTSSITASNGVCRIGADLSGGNPFNGKVWAAKVMNGSNVWVNPTFTYGWSAQDTTGLSKVDRAGNTWTLRGAATILPDHAAGSWVAPGRPIRLCVNYVPVVQNPVPNPLLFLGDPILWFGDPLVF